MEESKKKMVMIVIIVACLVAAGIITYATRSGGAGGTTAVWLKCRNADCGHEWQMNKEDYAAYVREHMGSRGVEPVQPGIPCPKCGEESGYPVAK